MQHFLTPQKIAELTGGRYVGAESARHNRVSGAVRDHRDVLQGNLFICIKGARVDGHDFASKAFEAGAACCLAERDIPNAEGPYVLVDSTLESIKVLSAKYRQMLKIPVIGITGSVGKTTGKEMIAAVLGSKYHVLRTPANLNNEIGVPLTLLSIDETHEVAVVEMGISDFGDMTILAKMVMPDIMVLTKIGYAHLDNLGDLDGVLKAKTEVFPIMKAGGTAVLNGDDERLRGFEPGMKKITYGFESHNDFRAENIITYGTDSVTCDIAHGDERFSVTIPVFGAHLTMAALAAAVIGHLLGLKNDEISRGLLSYAPVGSRANVTDTGYITLIDDCYNANPSSVRAALESLSALPGRRVAVLGDMLGLGECGGEMHREIGGCASNCGVDVLLCSGEQGALILDGFLAAGGKSARHFGTSAELIAALPEFISNGDNVLVKASRAMWFGEIVEKLKVLRK